MEQQIQTNKLKQDGQSLVEILVAMGILAIILPALLTGFVASREGKPQEENRLQAISILRKAEESLRSIREINWSVIATDGTYHVNEGATAWELVAGTETIGLFTKEIVIESVQRDLNGDMVELEGTIDPSTKRVTTTISWELPFSSSISSTTYLTRYENNTTWTQTTQSEFDNGELTNTTTTNNNGGEVELDTSSGGDWAIPLLIDTYSSPGRPNGKVIETVGNYTYLGTNSGGDHDFTILNTSDLTFVGGISLDASVNGISISGGYAYLATSKNSGEFIVIDISVPSNPSTAAQLDLSGTRDAYDVLVAGSFAYLGRDKIGGDEFYVIDISNPLSPNTVGGLDTGADVNAIDIQGNYAFLAMNKDTKEINIIDISTPSNPTSVGSYDSPGKGDGEAIRINGDYLYLGTEDNGGGDELFIFDITSPTNPSLVGSYDAGDDVRGIVITGRYALLATYNSSQEFQAVDISTPSNPTLYGSLDLDDRAKDIDILGDYAFLATRDNSQEALSILGGGGGGTYAISGEFESQSFDAGAEAAFNYIDFTLVEPSNTNINLQVATNNDDLTWNFTGPDGTGTTYYENPGKIYLSNILGQYFKFKAYLTGDGTNTPTLESVVVNYSP